MKNKSMKKVSMPELDPIERSKNFSEVSIGYTEEMALEEANRCINCKNKPCVKGCPVNIDIPEFIQLITQKEYDKAYDKIAENSSLPAICGRVCPQEVQCEQYCIRGIKGESVAIGRLERFVADRHLENIQCTEPKKTKGKKIAVIGSGPAGLACAADLAKKDYRVTIFEAFHKLGGVLTYGIPEFRLPKKLVEKEIDSLKSLGVKFETNIVAGKTLSLDDLKEMGFESIFIGSGAGLPKFLNIPGENLNGVYSANEFLTRVNLMKAYSYPNCDTPINVGKNVAIVGGGNVAMDAARVAKRLGADNVYIIYRRSETEMPARLEEVHHAKEEGILFKVLTNPTAVIGDENGDVKGLECVTMELSEEDSSGRRRPIEKKDSNHILDMDTVIIAIGQGSNPIITSNCKEIQTSDRGGIIVDETTLETTSPCVYAGGDVVTGAATVILAMGAGKTAAASIHAKLSKE